MEGRTRVAICISELRTKVFDTAVLVLSGTRARLDAVFERGTVAAVPVRGT